MILFHLEDLTIILFINIHPFKSDTIRSTPQQQFSNFFVKQFIFGFKISFSFGNHFFIRHTFLSGQHFLGLPIKVRKQFEVQFVEFVHVWRFFAIYLFKHTNKALFYSLLIILNFSRQLMNKIYGVAKIQTLLNSATLTALNVVIWLQCSQLNDNLIRWAFS